jgi:hypothetical protein
MHVSVVPIVAIAVVADRGGLVVFQRAGIPAGTWYF